jgi:hypothetical protein
MGKGVRKGAFFTSAARKFPGHAASLPQSGGIFRDNQAVQVDPTMADQTEFARRLERIRSREIPASTSSGKDGALAAKTRGRRSAGQLVFTVIGLCGVFTLSMMAFSQLGAPAKDTIASGADGTDRTASTALN